VVGKSDRAIAAQETTDSKHQIPNNFKPEKGNLKTMAAGSRLDIASLILGFVWDLVLWSWCFPLCGP
jgi:hypothetical protein